MKDELTGLAEEAVRREAERIAYERSEEVQNPQIQKLFYSLYKECIILGARMFIEKYEGLEENEELHIAMARLDSINRNRAERTRIINT